MSRKTKRQALLGCGTMIVVAVVIVYLITSYSSAPNPNPSASEDFPKSKEIAVMPSNIQPVNGVFAR